LRRLIQYWWMLDSSVGIVTVMPLRARDFTEAHLACYSIDIVGHFRRDKAAIT
jgi:hypothetical protein